MTRRLSQLNDRTCRRIAAVLAAVGVYTLIITASNPITVIAAATAAVVAGWTVIGNPVEQVSRTVALALAIRSHGPKPGVDTDRCYPARAEHFLRYIATGDNPRVVPRHPELVRRCVSCGAPEWCTADPDGAAVNTHDFEDGHG